MRATYAVSVVKHADSLIMGVQIFEVFRRSLALLHLHQLLAFPSSLESQTLLFKMIICLSGYVIGGCVSYIILRIVFCFFFYLNI